MSAFKNTQYNLLIGKLDAFIRTYYKNILLKGVLLSLTFILGLFLILVFVEYLAHFSSTIRAILFYFFLTGLSLSLLFLVIQPLFKLFRLGKTISREDASIIIGNHFPEVKDKLLNILQLQHTEGFSSELVHAAIERKTHEIRTVPFQKAIDLKKNLRYAKYLFIPLIVLLITSFVAPYILSKGSIRLLKYSTIFPKEFPYSFEIQNDELTCYEGDDFELIFTVKGSKRPTEIYLVYQGLEHRLESDIHDFLSYTFQNTYRDVTFQLTDGQNVVKEASIRVIPKSKITDFTLFLDYPDYVQIKDGEQKNVADLSIPEGTKVTWKYTAQNTQDISMSFLNEAKEMSLTQAKNVFIATHAPKQSGLYTVVLQNTHSAKQDTLLQSIKIIPDEFPGIVVEEFKDSIRNNILYYSGSIEDDYGFTKLECKVFLRNSEDQVVEEQIQAIPISKGLHSQTFYHMIDRNDWFSKPDHTVEYYFEVYDNDGVHGAKSTKSKVWFIKIPSLNELRKEKDELSTSLKKDLTESIKEAKNLQKELEQLWKDVANKRNMSWEEKNKINSLLERQKELQNQLEKDQKKNKDLLENTEQLAEKNELLEKQKKIQEMMEELLSDDMKKMLEELQKLMEEVNQEKRNEKLQDLKLSNEDIQKELDRSLELFKQLEFEQKMKDNIAELDRLSKEQNELNKQLEQKSDPSSMDAQEKKQEQLSQDFKNLEKELDKMKELNDKLEFKNDLPNTEEQENQVEQEMQNAQESLQKKDKKGASKSQKKAAQKMDELKKSMEQAQEAMAQEAQEENLEDMKQLLENLVKLSFEQEDLLKKNKKTSPNDPKYNEQIQTQKKLKDYAKMIEDSLFALSKRVPDIASTVNKELNGVNENIAKSLDYLSNRRTLEANSKQQLVMTSLNNLALLFDEMIQQAQQQMSQKEGDASCNKPGSKGKPKPGDMRKAQQQLSKKLEQLKNELQKQKDGKGNPGGTSMSKELAKMAAEQEAIRQQLQEMMQEMQSNGEKVGGDLMKIGDLMEETERDIVNKRITQQTINRQQDILTRLLESEKADRERDQDQKRESNEAKDEEKRNLLEEFKYKAKKQNNIDLLETIPPNMVDFYKQKVNAYFNK